MSRLTLEINEKLRLKIKKTKEWLDVCFVCLTPLGGNRFISPRKKGERLRERGLSVMDREVAEWLRPPPPPVLELLCTKRIKSMSWPILADVKHLSNRLLLSSYLALSRILT